jgi:hypothetical protein
MIRKHATRLAFEKRQEVTRMVEKWRALMAQKQREATSQRQSADEAPEKTKKPATAKKKTGDGLLIQWRRAWIGVEDWSLESGLCSTTRLVLWTVSGYMKMDGTGAFPSQETIAKDAALTLRAAKTHLKIAVKRKWLSRTKRPTSYGKGFRYEYAATFPEREST